MTTLAIDIGGTKLAAALVEDNLQIRERRELPTPASKTSQALRDALKALVQPLQSQAHRVAIASTGIIREGNLLAINPKSGRVASLSAGADVRGPHPFADAGGQRCTGRRMGGVLRHG